MNSVKEEKKRVVVGMTGKLDSVVTAYLLKQQGYDVIGVGIIFADGETLDYCFKEKIYTQCQIEDLNKTKEVCEKLGISFYGVNGKSIFKGVVIDTAVARRLLGDNYEPCVDCTRIKIEALIEKANLLEVDQVATGHYARIQWDKKTGEYFVLGSCDIENDQSYLLTGLDQRHLGKVIFPLGEMRRVDVEKIAARTGIQYVQDRDRRKTCLMNTPGWLDLVKHSSPTEYCKGGDIVTKDKHIEGEHSGIYNYFVGERKVKGMSGVPLQDRTLEVIEMNFMEKSVQVGHGYDFSYKHCFMSDFKKINSLDLSRPMNGYAQLGQFEMCNRKRCQIFFKSSFGVMIEFVEETKGALAPGTWIVLYTKEEGGKIIGSGTVWHGGSFHIRKYKYVMGEEGEEKPEESQDEEEESEEGEREEEVAENDEA